MKIVINTCFGGFGLSDEALILAVDRGLSMEPFAYDPKHRMHKNDSVKKDYGNGWVVMGYGESSIGDSLVKNGMVYTSCFIETKDRNHPALVSVVEELGDKANGQCAELKVVDIPDGIDFTIEEYDGSEHVAEKHQTWS